MPTYTLEIEAFGVFTANAPSLEIWADGALDSTHSISATGTTISLTITYAGSLPTSLDLTFNDAFASNGRLIEIQSVKINDRFVNTGNYLSTDTLTKSTSASVTVTNNEFLFDGSADPASSEFTTGATQTFTTGVDKYVDFTGSTNEVFDMLAGNDFAYTGSGNDKISGGAGNDILRAGAGNDLVYGDTGNDRLYGNDGDDSVYGGTGNDRLYGNAGDDELHGGAGDDRISGQADNDILTGGDGDDILTGGSGDDFLYGDADNDRLTGGTGNDTLDGGDGNDLVFGGAGVDHIHGGDGADILSGNDGDDEIDGGIGIDEIYGGADDDDIDGGDGDDSLYGDDGNDKITGWQGADTIEGGAGNDQIIGDGDGTAGADNINGDAGEDLINGQGGIDTIDGGADNDYIAGGDGDDIINGGTGDDILDGDDGASTQGWAFRYYNLGFDITTLAAAGFTLNGGKDNIYTPTTQGITQDLEPTIHNTGSFFALKYETYLTIETAGTYTFRTTSDDGSMLFLDGVQIVDNDGLHGNVTITSAGQVLEAGVYKLDATFFERTGGDVMEVYMAGPDTGGSYVDLESYANVNAVNGDQSAFSGADTINGGAGNDLIFGEDGADTLNGDAGNDTIFGGAGADIMDGGADDDNFRLENGDFVSGESITGNSGTDDILLTSTGTTVDFSVGTIATVEDLNGSSGNDNVTYTISQALGFDNIDLAGGTDNLYATFDAAYTDFTALGAPIITNTENGFLTAAATDNIIYLTGVQLDSLIFGGGALDMGAGIDYVALDSTSANLNIFGLTDAAIQNVTAFSGVLSNNPLTINMSGQTEGLIMDGSIFNDIYTGGAGNNSIDGNAGDDIINSGAGNDFIDGDVGDDVINAGAGNDFIDGGDGDDIIDGDGGDDIINGDAGNDIIDGGSGADDITGGTGVDTIDGGDGDDTINIESGHFVAGESITGGNDTDEIIFIGATTVDFTIGTIATVEELTGSIFNDNVTWTLDQALSFSTIDMAGGTDNLYTNMSGTVDVTALGTPTVSNAEHGSLTGSGGVDNITITGAQINALVFGSGTIDFGAGADVLNITSTSTTLNTLGLTNASIQGLQTISAATAGSGVTLTLSGQSENFTVTGSGSGDVITTGSGADTLNGGGGNDTLDGNSGVDTFDGGAGSDTIRLANGDFAAGESIDGNSGTDNITFTNATTVDFTTGTISSIENLNGSSGNDSVTYSVSQAAAFSSIDMGGGTDNMYTNISGTIDVTALGSTTIINAEHGSLTGSGGNDNLTITGTQLNALIFGAGTLNFGAGTDVLNITSTSTTLNTLGSTNASIQGLQTISAASAGSGVTISITGQTEDFTITGSGSGDVLTAGLGDDVLNGGGGNDTLNATTSSDILNGGAGNDILNSAASQTISATITSILASNSGVTYNSDLNSFYQYVNSSVNYATADSNASSATLTGMASVNGHLATITSQTEQDYIDSIVSNDAFVGAGDQDPTEGEWKWLVGPEAGVQFSNGSTAVNGWYNNWSGSQPNNNGGNQSRLEFGGSGTWDDTNAGNTRRYVIEWEADSLLNSIDKTVLNGGLGDDDLYGSNSGVDIFYFDNTSSTDTIYNFDATGRDQIDLSSILSSYDILTDDLNDFIRLTESGGNTTIGVDTAGGGSYTDIAVVDGVTGLDLYEMMAADNLIL